jgi:hypothetical protein
MKPSINAAAGRRQEPKLGSDAVRQRMAELAESGASLGQIRAHLAAPEPEGFGLTASRTSIYKRLKDAGIELKNESIATKVQAPTFAPEALALARREVSAEDLARHKETRRGRDESWLAQFAKEISGLIEDGYTYRGVWDLMAQKYPVVPQFAEPLTDKQKTDRLAVFIRRQRKKSESKPKARRLFNNRTPAIQSEPVAAAAAPARPTPTAQVQALAAPQRTRAALPTNGTNVLERKQELAAVADVNRASVSADELAAVQRKHGLKS